MKKNDGQPLQGYDYARIALGAGVILVGVLLLLAATGVLEFGDMLVWLWPVGIILSGLAVMTRQWGTAALLITLSTLGALLAATSPFLAIPGELSEHGFSVPVNGSLGMDLSYVAGTVTVGSASGDEFVLVANDYWKPHTRFSYEGDSTVVQLERGMEEPRFGDGVSWQVSVPQNVSSVLALDLVATDAYLNLTSVALTELVISTVGSDAEVVLPAANATVFVDATASEVVLFVPMGTGVRLQRDAVASDVSALGEFSLPAAGWQTLNENASTRLTISVDAVASDIKVVEE